MKAIRNVLRVFWRGLRGLIALLVGLIGVYIVLLVGVTLWNKMDRTPLPNGLELGHQYIWDGWNDFYLWTEEGDLIAPYILDLICYNDQYLAASTMDGPRFLYDIENGVLTLGTDREYLQRSRESGLRCSPGGTTGYTQFLVGAGLVVHHPERVRGCTLANPCPF